MAVRPVNNTPLLPRPTYKLDPRAQNQFNIDLVRNLFQELSEHAFALNRLLAPALPLNSYVIADLPAAADFPNHMVYVSDESGGAVPAFSDGTNWRRVTDRAIVS